MNENASQNGTNEKDARQKGPLEGVRVIEFGNFVAGPFAGQILADMGAEVIKIEPPTGDPWRVSQPFAPNESRTFLPLNRGVKSVTLNLKDARGQAALAKIVKMSDGAISNNRPDTALALGIDYESLSAINPAIIYVDITAYGMKGPLGGAPGFDLVMQGFTGAVTSEGKVTENGQPEVVWSSSYIDLSSAYCAAAGIMAGIIGRGGSGKGQKVETSLMMNALAMQCMRIIHMLDMPTPSMTWYQERYPRLIEEGKSYPEMQRDYQSVVRPSIYRCYYRAYRTKDGGLCLGTLDWAARSRLLNHLGLEDPRVTDPDFDYDTPEADRLAQDMVDTFERIFESKTTAEWVEELNARDIPCGPIRFSEDLVWDEQAAANNYIIELEHHTGHRYRTSGPILNFTAGMPDLKPSPALGEHNWDVLRKAGMTEDEIAAVVG
jgi:formyl-CoA transferase